jgi:hypothetical protein
MKYPTALAEGGRRDEQGRGGEMLPEELHAGGERVVLVVQLLHVVEVHPPGGGGVRGGRREEGGYQ